MKYNNIKENKKRTCLENIFWVMRTNKKHHVPSGYFPTPLLKEFNMHRSSNHQLVEKETKDMNSDRQKALDAALSQIERLFGKGSVMKLGVGNAPAEIETISTGSLGLDIALGIGGLPRGRIIEIYGPESSGKTTLALHVIAQAQ